MTDTFSLPAAMIGWISYNGPGKYYARQATYDCLCAILRKRT